MRTLAPYSPLTASVSPPMLRSSQYQPPNAPPPPSSPPAPLAARPAAPRALSEKERYEHLREAISIIDKSAIEVADSIGICVRSATNTCGRTSQEAPNPWIANNGRACAGNGTWEALEGTYCAYWGSQVCGARNAQLAQPTPLFYAQTPEGRQRLSRRTGGQRNPRKRSTSRLSTQKGFQVSPGVSWVLHGCLRCAVRGERFLPSRALAPPPLAGQRRRGGVGRGPRAAHRGRGAPLLLLARRGAQVPHDRRSHHAGGSVRARGVLLSLECPHTTHTYPCHHICTRYVTLPHPRWTGVGQAGPAVLHVGHLQAAHPGQRDGERGRMPRGPPRAPSHVRARRLPAVRLAVQLPARAHGRLGVQVRRTHATFRFPALLHGDRRRPARALDARRAPQGQPHSGT